MQMGLQTRKGSMLVDHGTIKVCRCFVPALMVLADVIEDWPPASAC